MATKRKLACPVSFEPQLLHRLLNVFQLTIAFQNAVVFHLSFNLLYRLILSQCDSFSVCEYAWVGCTHWRSYNVCRSQL